VVLEVVVVRVIRISRMVAITRAVRVRLPIGDRIVRLGLGRSGGSAATDQEVPSTEDTDREFLAGGVSPGGITGDGGSERRLRVKEGKVGRDVGVIDGEEH
jgi:hypothetical protein